MSSANAPEWFIIHVYMVFYFYHKKWPIKLELHLPTNKHSTEWGSFIELFNIFLFDYSRLIIIYCS